MSPIILSTILDRAKNQPLDFVMSYDSQPSALGSLDIHRQLLEMVVSKSHLWWEAFLYDFPVGLLSVFDAVQDRLPLLEAFTLIFPWSREGRNVGITESVNYFACAPVLEHVRVDYFPGDFGLLRLPWSQLVSLVASGCTSEEEFDVLSRLSCVESCDFHSLAENIPFVGHHETVLKLPSLRRMAATNWEAFDCLLAPNLKEVESIMNQRSVASLKTIIDRSSCVLNYLSVWALEDHSIDDAVSLLRVVPTVTVLRIYQSKLFPSFISQLTVSHDLLSNILPNLQRLSIEADCVDYSMPHFDFDWLVQLFKSRRQNNNTSNVATLETFNFETDLQRHCIPVLGTPKSLDIFREEGMVIHINTSSDLSVDEDEDVVLNRLGFY